MHDDPPVPSLVTRAQAGDQQAWDALVDRYAPLVWSICRRYRLADADADGMTLLEETVFDRVLAGSPTRRSATS